MEELRSRKVSTMKCSHIVTVVMNKWKFNKTKKLCLRIKMRTFNATVDLSPHLYVSGSKRVNASERRLIMSSLPFFVRLLCLFHALHGTNVNKFFFYFFSSRFSCSFLSPFLETRFCLPAVAAVIAYYLCLCEIISA